MEENDIVIDIKVLNLGKIKINTYNDFNEIKFKKLSELNFLNLWIEFSKLSTKYKDGCCDDGYMN